MQTLSVAIWNTLWFSVASLEKRADEKWERDTAEELMRPFSVTRTAPVTDNERQLIVTAVQHLVL